MKSLIASVAVGVVVAVITYITASNRTAADYRAREAAIASEWERTRQALEDDLRKAKSRPASVEVREVVKEVEVPAAVDPLTDPRQVIQQLMAIKVSPGEMEVYRRRIIHHFETLVDLGPAALPPIRAFLATSQEVYFAESDKPKEVPDEKELEKIQGRERTETWRRSLRLTLPDGTFSNPSSLRLGLLEAAFRIGGDEGEAVLADTLRVTARGIEAAWITVWLEKISPGKYRDVAIATASDLLLHPIEIPGGSFEDRLSEGYLYSVLVHFGDTSFASRARGLLVTADGRLDHSAMGYLVQVEKESLMPTVFATYNDPRLESAKDRSRLVAFAQNRFGSDPQADLLFRNLVASGNKEDAYNRYGAISSLDGGGISSYGREPKPTDPAVIQNRLRLIESIAKVELDEKTLALVERTYNNLQAIARGEPLPGERRN